MKIEKGQIWQHNFVSNAFIVIVAVNKYHVNVKIDDAGEIYTIPYSRLEKEYSPTT